ncbi:MAG: hypothetical protein QNJ30_12930 [Kiloniellales bacterium]|nr:hypothetical protein [Kiloniellales bacterium]
MANSLIFGLLGGLVVAGIVAFLAYRSSGRDEDQDDFDDLEDDVRPAGRKPKRSLFGGFSFSFGFGRRKSAPQVERRSEKVAGWRKEIEEACDATGLIKSEAVSWIAPLIIDGHKRGSDDHTIATKISGWGNALCEDDKSRLGVRADAKLGREYVDALTRKGRKRPLAAAYFVVQRATHAHSQSERLKHLCGDDHIEGIEIIATEGALTCLAAQDIEGKVFEPKKAPSLPLRRCDAESCRCVYQGIEA